MPSLDAAVFFPGHREILTPALAVDELMCRGLKLGPKIRLMERVDPEGHLLDTGSEVVLTAPLWDDLKGRLLAQESFSAVIGNSEMTFDCFFAPISFNPHIDINWPRRWFNELPMEAAKAYYSMLGRFARRCGAAYAVFVSDPTDFEDRFLEIDGRRVLDTSVTPYSIAGISYTVDRVYEIWVADGQPPVVGLDAAIDADFDASNGFYVYRLPKTPWRLS